MVPDESGTGGTVMRRRFPIAVVALAALVALQSRSATAVLPTEEEERIQNSIQVLRDLTATPDKAIPRHLLERADAIVVIPTLIKGGFIFGAKHGRGVMSVRHAQDRAWSDPGFVAMTGGSIGWQIGVQSVDLVFLVMNRKGVDDLLADRFTIGGAASVAAGPVGRSADAATDAKVASQILAYSRASGLFAGATLEGASLRADKDAINAFYARPLTLKDIVASSQRTTTLPKIATTWRDALKEIAGAK
jgi:lipid-binding SYLF domain-containing protein